MLILRILTINDTVVNIIKKEKGNTMTNYYNSRTAAATAAGITRNSFDDDDYYTLVEEIVGYSTHGFYIKADQDEIDELINNL